MSASNDTAMAALAAKVEQLGQVCSRLSRENGELRHQLSRLQAAQGHVALPAAAARRAAAGAAAHTPAGGGAAAAPARASSDPGQQPGRKVSRRAIGKALGAAAAGVVGAAALADLATAPASAANGDPVTAGEVTISQASTTLLYGGSTSVPVVFLANDSTFRAEGSAFRAALAGWAGSGLTAGSGGCTTGIYGFTQNGAGFGVVGTNSASAGTGAGVSGQANAATTAGVSGSNIAGVGVLGQSESANGVRGMAAGNAAGVNGDNSGSGPGVHGQSASGRGGQFAGAAAQVQLVPGSAATHPTSGHAGDLYADSNGRLWFCTASGAQATWKQIV